VQMYKIFFNTPVKISILPKKIKMIDFDQNKTSKNQKIKFDLFGENVEVYVKREDLLHPFVSGNKWRKLKYNLIRAKKENHSTILTFGGAFSNHILAISFACKILGFRSIGVIRGEEISEKIAENPTLNIAQKNGMKFHFISREEYRKKHTEEFIENLQKQFGTFYLIPEGGTNDLAVKGCEEILTEQDNFFDYICCSVGTGGTISGIINTSKSHQNVLGFSALKGNFLDNEIRKFTKNDRWKLFNEYHFGGYTRLNSDLIWFINEFKKQTNILLDPIYTGKMCYGIADLIHKNYFKKESKIVIVHTGGQQGILGINQLLEQQNLPKINV